MTPTEGQTTAPSGADVDVLAVLKELTVRNGYFGTPAYPLGANMLTRIEQARTAVAALIARNAELEAERDAITAGRDAYKTMLQQAEEDVSKLAAENLALRERQTTHTDQDVLDEVRAMVKLCFESQATFAKSRNVSPAYVSDVLNGRRAMPEQWAVLAGFSRPKWFRDTSKRWTDALARTPAKENDDG